MLSKIGERIYVLHRRIKYTCGNLTVHGPSFLVREDVHFIYRLIYFVIYLQVWILAVITILKYYTHYQQNTIRFTSHMAYLDWNTTFPSITVCEIANTDKINALTEVEDGHKLDRFIADIAFFSGTCYSCISSCEESDNCIKDFAVLSSYYRTVCQDLFVSCKWNDEPINCCKHFKPIKTEYGLCFSINNKHAQGKQYLRFASTNKRQMGALEIVASQDYEAFLHSSEDVPFWNMEYDRRITVIYGSEASMTFSIMDVVNEPEVASIAPDIRNCRFPNEVPDNFLAYKHYSYSVCIIQCRIEAQLDLCDCIHHMSPSTYKDRFCDLEGLKCLTRNYKSLRKLKVPGPNETGLECDCLPSCTEPDYNVVSKKLKEPMKDVQAGAAVFMLGNRPYQRMTRQVARTTLDLVVAMGNVFGLCFGGSLLSIAELIYYLCFRKWKHATGKKSTATG